MAGGVAYWRGLYSANEGLARWLKVCEDTVSGQVLWSKWQDVKLQLVPPFASSCTCSKGGNCRHVVTLGLTFLHEERVKAGTKSFPQDEETLYLVSMLEHNDLRGLAMEILSSVPDAISVAKRYLNRPGRFTETNEYTLDFIDDDPVYE